MAEAFFASAGTETGLMAKSYSDKLKDPRWQKMRLEVLERDKWRCQLCYAEHKTLHVHHGYYEGNKQPWEYDTRTLHCVCEDCHQKADDLRCDLRLACASLHLVSQRQLFALLAELLEVPDVFHPLFLSEFRSSLHETEECQAEAEDA